MVILELFLFTTIHISSSDMCSGCIIGDAISVIVIDKQARIAYAFTKAKNPITANTHLWDIQPPKMNELCVKNQRILLNLNSYDCI